MLKEVGKVIHTSARKDDRVCRLGGEEFMVICANADAAAGYLAADRLRKMVRALSIQIGDTALRTTVSVGLASKEPGTGDEDALVDAADQEVHGPAYPAGPLRDVLANTAALIRADLGTSMVFTAITIGMTMTSKALCSGRIGRSIRAGSRISWGPSSTYTGPGCCVTKACST